jgi:hypothetical protein
MYIYPYSLSFMKKIVFLLQKQIPLIDKCCGSKCNSIVSNIVSHYFKKYVLNINLFPYLNHKI